MPQVEVGVGVLRTAENETLPVKVMHIKTVDGVQLQVVLPPEQARQIGQALLDDTADVEVKARAGGLVLPSDAPPNGAPGGDAHA